MWSRTAPTTAGFVLFAMSNVIAQNDTLSSSSVRVPRDRVSHDRVSIVAGFADGQRRDVVVSPLTYAGTGYAASAAYDHVGARSTVAVTATWDAQRFRPQTVATGSTERVMQGNLRVTALRSLDDGAWTLSAGATAGAWGMGTEHRYADPGDSRAGFFAAFLTAGPAAEVRRVIAGGSASIELDAPVFGFSDRSYSVARADNASLALRRIGLNELRALNGSLSYAPRPLDRTGLLFSYHFSIMSYRDAQPLRAASQSFSVGFSRYFGGAR